MAITSNNDLAEFPGADSVNDGVGSDAGDAEQPARGPEAGADAAGVPVGAVWVLCRKGASGDVESVRAFDDEARARADLELAESISEDEFWVSAVPLIETAEGEGTGASMSRVQALALTWLAQGAEAEASVPLDDPVVVSPRHVRGFVSVPSHEWRDMEERGWVRDGLITPEGAARVGLARSRDI